MLCNYVCTNYLPFRNVISANVTGERGAILTTHSMEEADALCSRVGILVKGQLK